MWPFRRSSISSEFHASPTRIIIENSTSTYTKCALYLTPLGKAALTSSKYLSRIDTHPSGQRNLTVSANRPECFERSSSRFICDHSGRGQRVLGITTQQKYSIPKCWATHAAFVGRSTTGCRSYGAFNGCRWTVHSHERNTIHTCRDHPQMILVGRNGETRQCSRSKRPSVNPNSIWLDFRYKFFVRRVAVHNDVGEGTIKL